MENEKQPVILAFAGKGGVGKTSLSALTVRLLHEAQPGKRILAIDADPAIGLATALGVEVGITVDDIRRDYVRGMEAEGCRAAMEQLKDARSRVTSALVEENGIFFLAIGRPEDAGCYCKINGYLREIIGYISASFDYVVIDGEAGIEQIIRRVLENVTHLMLVTDTSRKGMTVVNTIYKIAREQFMFRQAGYVVNRMLDPRKLDELEESTVPMLACIPEDRTQILWDMMGKTVWEMPLDSTIVLGIRHALKVLKLL